MDLRGGSLSDHTSSGGQIFNQIMQVFDRSPSGRPRLTGFVAENVNGSAVRVDFFLHRHVTRCPAATSTGPCESANLEAACWTDAMPPVTSPASATLGGTGGEDRRGRHPKRAGQNQPAARPPGPPKIDGVANWRALLRPLSKVLATRDRTETATPRPIGAWPPPATRKSHNGFPNHLLRRDIQLIENFTPRKQWQLPIQILRKIRRQKASTRCPRRGIGSIFGKDQLVGHGCSVGLRHQSRPCFYQYSMPHGPQHVSDRANRPMLQPNLTFKSIGQSDTGFRNPRPSRFRRSAKSRDRAITSPRSSTTSNSILRSSGT